MGNSAEKKCNCGHTKKEHMLAQKSLSILDVVLFHDRVATLQEGRGECLKCHCPEYKKPSKFHPRRGMDYSPRTTKNEDPEERCTRCGRLLSNHEGVNHPFQDTKTTRDAP